MLSPNRAPFTRKYSGHSLSAKRATMVHHILKPQTNTHRVTNAGWGILADPLFVDKFPGYGLYNWEKFRKASYQESLSAKTRLSLRDVSNNIS